MNAKIIAVFVSDKKGIAKSDIKQAKVIEGFGIENDAHGGNWNRQISLLAFEKIKEMQDKDVNVVFGDFGENIVTEGIELDKLPLSTKIQIGTDVILIVTQIGKDCTNPCSIFHKVGYCIMPEVGIFTKVLTGGEIKIGDELKIIFKPASFPVGIIVVSDSASKGERISTTEALIEKIIRKIAGDVKNIIIVPDERTEIAEALLKFINQDKVSLILTTGGTGLSPRDNTPEATKDVITKEIPGFAEAMRMQTFNLSNRSILSRAVAGFCDETIIINLPGSPKGVKECLEVILTAIPHAIELIKGSVRNCGENKEI